MRTFRLCDFNSDMVVSYTAWSMNVRDTLPCIHRSHAYFYSLISLQSLGFHAVPFIVNFLSMFGLMSAGFLPISCFHLKNAASLGDALSVKLMSLNILWLRWRLKGLQCCWGQETSELRSWRLWKVYYKSPLYDMYPFMAHIAFLNRKNNAKQKSSTF